jgi:hypothetical protein
MRSNNAAKWKLFVYTPPNVTKKSKKIKVSALMGEGAAE